MSAKREFKDVRSQQHEDTDGALPVDDFRQSLEALQAEIATEKNRCGSGLPTDRCRKNC